MARAHALIYLLLTTDLRISNALVARRSDFTYFAGVLVPRG